MKMFSSEGKHIPDSAFDFKTLDEDAAKRDKDLNDLTKKFVNATKPNMIIATSITQEYLERSKPFFESVNTHFEGRKLCFTIGFETTIEGWECIKTEFPDVTWKPANRKDYASLQHGEFVKYIPDDINPDDLIAFCDSDMVLQKKWDLNFKSTRGLTVTASSWPLNTLMQVVSNLGLKGSAKKKLCKKYNIHKDFKEFCACLVIATLDSWENLYKHCKENYSLLDSFKHHAAWQLLINVVALNNFPKVFLLPDFVVNASWYEGTKANGSPLSIEIDVSTEEVDKKSIEPVYFNHTKFNDVYQKEIHKEGGAGRNEQY